MIHMTETATTYEIHTHNHVITYPKAWPNAAREAMRLCARLNKDDIEHLRRRGPGPRGL